MRVGSRKVRSQWFFGAVFAKTAIAPVANGGTVSAELARSSVLKASPASAHPKSQTNASSTCNPSDLV
jgi:hypothetical protein